MNKFYPIIALALFSTGALANVDGVYVQGSVGLSKLSTKHDGEKLTDDKVLIRASVGKQVGRVRYALDYSDFGKVESVQTEVFEADEGYHNGPYIETETMLDNIKVRSFGVSAIYDFPLHSAVNAYAGLRVGANKIDAKQQSTTKTVYDNKELGTTETASWHQQAKTKIGVGVLAGVQYQLTSNVALDAGVEYNQLGKFDQIKAHQYGVTAGLRYNF